MTREQLTTEQTAVQYITKHLHFKYRLTMAFCSLKIKETGH